MSQVACQSLYRRHSKSGDLQAGYKKMERGIFQIDG